MQQKHLKERNKNFLLQNSMSLHFSWNSNAVLITVLEEEATGPTKDMGQNSKKKKSKIFKSQELTALRLESLERDEIVLQWRKEVQHGISQLGLGFKAGKGGGYLYTCMLIVLCTYTQHEVSPNLNMVIKSLVATSNLCRAQHILEKDILDLNRIKTLKM